MACAAIMAAPAAALAQTGAPVGEAVGLEEIVVTAQKRSERLQETPVAVTALTAESMERAGISASRDLTFVTPGLVFAQATFTARPQIRGVATRGVGPGDEAIVPIYIDGVYQPSQQANFFEFNNIKQVEVLRGPQGTLFGRNAVGGAINVHTLDPTPGFSGKADVSFGSFAEKVGNLYLSGGGDTLAANIAIHANADHGYMKTPTKRQARKSFEGVRTKLLYTPTEDMRIVVGASYSNSHDNTGNTVLPIDGVTQAKLLDPRVPIATGYSSFSTPGQYWFAIKQQTAWINAVKEFDKFDLTAIVANLYTSYAQDSDPDATPINSSYNSLNGDDRSYSAELRATSKGEGRLHWIGGVFLFKDTARYGFGEGYYRARSNATSATTFLQSISDAKAYAVFGEVTYDLTDKLSVIGGLRYSHEDRDFEQWFSSQSIGTSVTPRFAPPHNGPAVSTSFSKVTPRLTVKYAVTDDLHAYATYSQAFKSGIFNASSTALPLTPVEPETLTAYEAGFKADPSRSLRLNVAGYHYKYTNMQVSSRAGAGGSSTLQNAATSKIYGAEAELAWIVTPQWNVNGSVSYNHARYESFPGAIVFTVAPPRVVQGVTVTGPGLVQAFADASGNRIPTTPDWTFNISSVYTVPAFDGDLAFSGNYYWTSSTYSDAGNSFLMKSWESLNASITWTAPDHRTSIGIWSTNLTNNRHYIQEGVQATARGGALASPRRVGIRFGYEFD
jgi:iron complex outermembrane receptor protein